MDNQPAPQPASLPSSFSRLWPWFVVLLVVLFVGFARVRLLDVLLERDEGEYAYAGQLILQGIPPYELAYNMKLPGTYYAYALGMAVFGETPAGIHLTLLVANAVTIVFVFLLGRKLFGVTAGLVAAASYGVMSISLSVLGLAAHATHFVVLFAVPATLLLLKWSEDKRRTVLFTSGLLYGLAFLMKQQGICFCLFGVFFLVWQAIQSKLLFSGDFLKNGVCLGLGIGLPFGLMCLYLALAGVFHEFWFWTFTYAGSYVTALPLAKGFIHLTAHLKGTFDLCLGYWIILAMGLPLAFLNRRLRARAFLAVAFWAFSFLGVAIGLYFRTHYFVLVLPALAILIGLAVSALQQAWRFPVIENVFKSLPVILFVTVLAWTVFYQATFFFQISPARFNRSVYEWDPFAEAQAVARYLDEHSTADARVAVMGSEPEIYFYAHRHSATGYIYTYGLMEAQPNAKKMQREMMREIESAAPQYLVRVTYASSWMFQPGSDHTILQQFDQYANRFYEQVGIVSMSSTGAVECLWDEAARNQPLPQGQYITVYRRNAGAVAAPAALN